MNGATHRSLGRVLAFAVACELATTATPARAATDADPCASLSNLVSRPTAATAACAVKPGDGLLETGSTVTSTGGGGGTTTALLPQANLRLGVAPRLEIDLVPPSYERQSGSPPATGTSDAFAGFKYQIGATSKMIYGVNVLSTLDTGSVDFSANGDGVLANVNAALSLSPAIGLFATFGYNAQSGGTRPNPERYRGFDPALGATVAVPLGLTVFAEGFGASSTAPGGSGLYGFDTGLQKDIGPRVQLDVNLFEYPRLQTGAHQSSIGFGAAYLFGR